MSNVLGKIPEGVLCMHGNRQTKLTGERMAIVFDGERWHVRSIRAIEHDLDRDEKVYRCDRPISNDHATLAEAVEAARCAGAE